MWVGGVRSTKLIIRLAIKMCMRLSFVCIHLLHVIISWCVFTSEIWIKHRRCRERVWDSVQRVEVEFSVANCLFLSLCFYSHFELTIPTQRLFLGHSFDSRVFPKSEMTLLFYVHRPFPPSPFVRSQRFGEWMNARTFGTLFDVITRSITRTVKTNLLNRMTISLH